MPQTLQADVIIAPNQLILNTGLGISLTCEQVQDCIFTMTNNFWTYNDGANSVTFNPSSDAGNQISVGTDGRPFVPPASLAVQDTPCLDLTLVAGVLSGNPVISPNAGNLIDCLGNGLFVSPSDVSITGISSDCIQVGVSEPTVNNFEVTAIPILSIAEPNALQCLADGLFVPVVDVQVAVTPNSCIDLTVFESPANSFLFGAAPILSPTVGNALQCLGDGLYVSSAASGSTVVVGADSDCLSTGVVEAPAGTFTVTVDPIISADVGNTLECRLDGLFAQGGVALEGDTCSPSTPGLFGLVLGSDLAGAPEWQNPGRTDKTVGAVTLNEINDATNRDTVFWLTDNITLPTPTDRCSRYDIDLKNISASSVTITAADLIDGQGVITLEGTSTGGYPFGNDGGEAVHLFYSFTDTTWRVL